MPLRAVNCPHCFREVFVNTDSICPACKGDVTDKSDAHDELTVMEFVDGEVLPPLCVVCGKAAQYHVIVGEKNEGSTNGGLGILSRLAGALGGLISIKINQAPPLKEYKISVEFPVCEHHRAAKSLKPVYIDYRRYRMAVPAHKDFIALWKNPERLPGNP